MFYCGSQDTDVKKDAFLVIERLFNSFHQSVLSRKIPQCSGFHFRAFSSHEGNNIGEKTEFCGTAKKEWLRFDGGACQKPSSDACSGS